MFAKNRVTYSRMVNYFPMNLSSLELDDGEVILSGRMSWSVEGCRNKQHDGSPQLLHSSLSRFILSTIQKWPTGRQSNMK